MRSVIEIFELSAKLNIRFVYLSWYDVFWKSSLLIEWI